MLRHNEIVNFMMRFRVINISDSYCDKING